MRGTLSAGLSFAALSFLGTTLVALATSVFIARLYGARVVGEYALVYAPVGAVWLLSTVREQPALQREAAVLPARHPRITALFYAVSAFSTALTIVVSVIVALITYFLFRSPIDHPGLFVPAVVNIAGYAIFTNACANFDSIFIAFRDGRRLFSLRLHQALLFLALVVAARAVSGSVWSLVVATVASWVTPCMHRAITIRRWLAFRTSRAELRLGFAELPAILRFGLQLTPSGLLWGASDQVGTWVLGALSSITAVGAYNRAWSLGQRLLDARVRLSELLFPTLVERHAGRDQEGFDRALIDSLRYTTAFMLMFAATGAGAAHSVMAVFGPGFTGASNALAFLLLVPVFTTIATVSSQAMIATGRALAISVGAAARLVVTVPAVLVLSTQLGITGTAIGMALGGAAQVLCQFAFQQRDVLALFDAWWPRRQLLGQLAAYGTGFAVAHTVTLALPGYAGLVLALCAGVLAYLGAIVAVGGVLPRDRQRLALAVRRLAALTRPGAVPSPVPSGRSAAQRASSPSS